ncbi:hypothetical protein HDV06_002170 [Boothiomyces sp. JEL0866]|nr:hypothetical protein HDV06_002170 [Boothiomyces sp. JEL0866]
MVALLAVVVVVFTTKVTLEILSTLNIFNFEYSHLIGKSFTIFVVSEDNLQNFYLTFLIYNSLHHKTKAIENKSDNDLCFNFVAVHTLCMTGLFHQFKTLAMIKITSRIKALQKNGIDHQVKYGQELPTILIAELPLKKVTLQKPKSPKTRGRYKSQRSTNSTLNNSNGLSAIIEKKTKQVSFSL